MPSAPQWVVPVHAWQLTHGVVELVPTDHSHVGSSYHMLWELPGVLA
jgi:hypothetical protein